MTSFLTRNFSRTRGTLALTLIVGALACLVAVFKTGAANPTSGTLTPTSSRVEWDGNAAGGVSNGEDTCVEGVSCDTFTLTVSGTPADWAGKRIVIDISWVLLASDYDLYVHRNSNAGDLVARSVTRVGPGIATNESAAIEANMLEEDGTTVLTVHVVYFAATAGDQYQGTARVASTDGTPPDPETESPNWTIRYHGTCCEGNLAAAGPNTFTLLPVLVTGNKITKSSDGGKTWAVKYPPAPASFPFGIEGDMQAFGNDVIFFGTELADAVVARSEDFGETWTTIQVPLASGGNDQAWAYLGPLANMRPTGPLPLDEAYVLAGWMRIGSAVAFSFDGGRTWTDQSPLVGNNGDGPEHVVCHQNAQPPPNPAPGDTRIANPLFRNQKAGRHGTWGTDRKFYWTETIIGNPGTLYICQTDDFINGASWTGNKHPVAPGPRSNFVVTHSAFDNNGTLYVLHGNKLYVSLNQGKTIAFTHTLPRAANPRPDRGADQYLAVNCGTAHIALNEAVAGGRGRILYLRGTRVDTAQPTWDVEVVDEVPAVPGNPPTEVRLDFMQIVLNGNDIPTISYTTPNVQVTTASRNAPMGGLGGNECSLVSVSAVSRKTHGGTAVFDIPLPLDAAPATPGVESRRGGGANNGSHQVIVSVGAAPSFSGVVVTPAAGKTAELDGAPTLDAATNQITINLKNVSDDQRLTITLQSLSAAGGAAVDFNIPMGVAVGDTNGDGDVNSGDAQQTRNRSGQQTDGTNSRSDVNTDATVNSGDAFIVRGNSGQSIAP